MPRLYGTGAVIIHHHKETFRAHDGFIDVPPDLIERATALGYGSRTKPAPVDEPDEAQPMEESTIDEPDLGTVTGTSSDAPEESEDGAGTPEVTDFPE